MFEEGESSAGRTSPHGRKRPAMRVESFTKLRQVLNYSSSVDKVSELLGVDAPTVYEIYKKLAEEQIQKKTRKNSLRNKKNSKKALSLLGRDPSKEKLQKTLGIDEESVHQVEEDNLKQKELRMNAYRKATRGSPNKKKCAKALNTLGLDLSIEKATQLLGVDEDTLRHIYHEEQRLQEERILRKRRKNTSYLHDKKSNRKAYHVVGYDPSFEKVLDTLGVEAGTAEAAQVSAILPSGGMRPEEKTSRWGNILVYSLSAMILFAALTRST